MNLETTLEGLLFFKGEPVSVGELSKMTKHSKEEVIEALSALSASLQTRGLRVVLSDDTVELRTAPELSSMIEALIREDLEKDLGKAGLEVLTTILYHGPISRSRIDYIRGVNSTFSIRQLMIRGLVERVENPKDQRAFLYKPTVQLLSYLGIETVSALPEYARVRESLERFEQTKNNDAPGAESTTTGTEDAAPDETE